MLSLGLEFDKGRIELGFFETGHLEDFLEIMRHTNL